LVLLSWTPRNRRSFLRDLDDHLDDAPLAHGLEGLFEVLQPMDAMRDELPVPPGPPSLRHGHVAHALLEVRAVRVYRAHHGIVAQHHVDVEGVSGDLEGALAA